MQARGKKRSLVCPDLAGSSRRLRQGVRAGGRKGGLSVTALAASLNGANAVFRRDMAIFLSYRTRLLMQFTTGFVSIALFYYISLLVSVGGFGSDEYFAFVVVGIAITEVM